MINLKKRKKNEKPNIQYTMPHGDFISGFYLESQKWEKSKTEHLTWTRGEGHGVVKYDGCQWYYNGKPIEDSIIKNPKLKIPSVNPSLPPKGFKDWEDYYSRLMENK